MSITTRAGGSGSSGGPLVVGNQLLFALFGILSVQTYLFYLGSRDKVLIRVLVFGVYTLMLAQLILAGRDFFVRVTSEHLIVANLGWVYVPLLGGTVGAVVQIFYAWRIYILSEKHAVPYVLVMVSLIGAGAAYTSAAFGSRISTISGLNSDSLGLRIGSTVWYASSAACDIAIAVYMTYLLTRNNKDTAPSTRAVVGRIVRLTFETNTLTAGVAVVTLVLLLILPGKTYFTTLSLLLPGIYANTFLVMLNLRLRVTRPGITTESVRKSETLSILPSSRARLSPLVSSQGDDEDAINFKDGRRENVYRRSDQELQPSAQYTGGHAL